jgi:hypothetical protein
LRIIPFANAYCADGSTTGIGVSLTAASDDLLIYLNGGGACWDQATCNSATTGSPLGPCATNLSTGYDETHGQPAWSTFADPATFAGSIFDRTDSNNPLRTFNFIHVFYCTGDSHAGSQVATYTITGRDGQLHPVHHVGYQNLVTYLNALTGERRGTSRPRSQRVVPNARAPGRAAECPRWRRTCRARIRTGGWR